MKHPDNKGTRNRIRKKLFKKRLDILCLNEKDGNFNAFKSDRVPCSCWVCRDKKYDRSKEKRKQINYD